MAIKALDDVLIALGFTQAFQDYVAASADEVRDGLRKYANRTP